MALDIVLRNIVPAIISSSLGAYLGWRLAKHGEDAVASAPALAPVSDSRATECVRVIDFILEEMLRYQFYPFDRGDLSSARQSLKALGANLSYLLQKSSELKPRKAISNWPRRFVP